MYVYKRKVFKMAKIVLQDIVVHKTEMGTRIDYKYDVSTSIKKFLRGGGRTIIH